MRRRTYLSAVGLAGLGTLAGCTGNAFETTRDREPPLLENRPEAVYIPTHKEGMKMSGMGMAGGMMFHLMYSYAHRFWVIEPHNGEYEARRIDIQRDDAVHLMISPFHEPTGTVIPDIGLSIEIMKDGSLVSEEVIYPMLSQRMGFHYGANFPLEGDGTYDVKVSAGANNHNKFGEFEGMFESPTSATIEFEYSEAERNEIMYQILDEEAGQKDALEPMSMEMMPTGSAPSPLPGTKVGEAMSGDANFLVHTIRHGRFASGGHSASGNGDSESGDENGHDESNGAGNLSSHGDDTDHSGMHDDEGHSENSSHSGHSSHGNESHSEHSDHGNNGSDGSDETSDDVGNTHQTEATGTYIAVSAQTPHNGLVIPGMALHLTVDSNAHGEQKTLYDGSLEPGLDSEFGFHYGAMVDHLHSGDTLTIDVETIPQIARHEGYETAFLDMDQMTIEVP